MNEIEYFEFDRITLDDLGCYWAYRGEGFCQVYPLTEDDTEEELMAKGFAKCDAPGTETFSVELFDAQELFQ